MAGLDASNHVTVRRGVAGRTGRLGGAGRGRHGQCAARDRGPARPDRRHHRRGGFPLQRATNADIPAYDHEILKPGRVAELIDRVKRTSVGGRRLLVSASFRGNQVPTDEVVRASDFVLVHGNGVNDPSRIVAMVRETRAPPGYGPKPIVFNEDDHYDFEKPRNNFVAATSVRASWGYFDFRRAGERFDEGYQSVPVHWAVSSSRKQASFGVVASMSR